MAQSGFLGCLLLLKRKTSSTAVNYKHLCVGILGEFRLIPCIVGQTKGKELTRGKEMTESCTLNLHIRYKLNIGV